MESLNVMSPGVEDNASSAGTPRPGSAPARSASSGLDTHSDDEGDGMPAVREVAAHGPPFLTHDAAKEFPVLQQIHKPLGCTVEVWQQCRRQAVRFPLSGTRARPRVHAYAPTASSLNAFRDLWNGFMSARRAVTADEPAEAANLEAAEAAELRDRGLHKEPMCHSLPPRPVGVSLLIPAHACKSEDAVRAIDAFAALSDGQALGSKAPLATTMRFQIYVQEACNAMAAAVSRDAFVTIGVLDSICLVVRWVEEGEPARVRVEALRVADVLNECAMEELAGRLQQRVLAMASEHPSLSSALPPAFSQPAVRSKVGHYERQVADAANDLRAHLCVAPRWTPPNTMRAGGVAALAVVPGAYARLAPKACVNGMLSNNDCFHASVLCADTRQARAEAVRFLRQHDRGLPQVAGTLWEGLHLHLAGSKVTPIGMNDTVSLYGLGGVPGDPIGRSTCITGAAATANTWVYQTMSAIVPIQTLQQDFDILSCDGTSALPSYVPLQKHLLTHLQRSMILLPDADGVVEADAEAEADRAHTPCAHMLPLLGKPSKTDSFLFEAFCLDMSNGRMYLGDAIAQLRTAGAPRELVGMLDAVAVRHGLDIPLRVAFEHCGAALDECKRLKDALEVAINGSASPTAGKKRRTPTPVDGPARTIKPNDIKKLFQALDMRPAVATVCLESMDRLPRSRKEAFELADAIYSSYACASPAPEVPHHDAVVATVSAHADVLDAINAGFQQCMAPPGGVKRAFALVHGSGDATIYALAGGGAPPSTCGIGAVFEAAAAAVLVVKLSSTSRCMITPMVKKGFGSKQSTFGAKRA